MSMRRQLLCAVLLLAGLGSRPAAASGIFGVWNPVGPGAGSLTSLAAHPAAPSTLWLGMAQGGVYRSADRGGHWVWAGRPFADRGGVVAIAADTSRANGLWVADSRGFWSSADGGTTWTLLAGRAFTGRIAHGTSPQAILAPPGFLYVTTSGRVLQSADGGHAWRVAFDVATLGGGAVQALAASASAPRRLYLAAFGPERPVLLRSVDAGASWTPLASAPVGDAGFEVLLATAQGLYAVRHGADAALFRSTDAGLTWRELRDPESGAGHDVRALAVDPRSARTLVMTSAIRDREYPETALRVSRDAGRTWIRVGPAPAGALLLDAQGGLYARSERRLQRSLDGGGSFTTLALAPDAESSFARLALDAARPASRLLTVGWATYRSGDRGATWRWVNAPYGVRDVAADPADPSRLLAITGSAAFVSDDAGRAWRRTGDGLWYLEALTRVDAQTLLAAGAGIARSEDDGESWRIALPGWAAGSDDGRWVQKIAADSADRRVIYALSFQIRNLEPPHDVLAGAPSVLWKSTDAGRTWRKAAANLRTFAMDPDGGRVLAVRDRDLLRSADGRAWTRVGTTPALVHELVRDPLEPDTWYAAGAKVWRTRDGGATWQLVADGWSPATLQLEPPGGTGGRVLLGADRFGVLRTTLAPP